MMESLKKKLKRRKQHEYLLLSKIMNHRRIRILNPDFFICAEDISQAGMQTFLPDAVRECEKRANRVFHQWKGEKKVEKRKRSLS